MHDKLVLFQVSEHFCFNNGKQFDRTHPRVGKFNDDLQLIEVGNGETFEKNEVIILYSERLLSDVAVKDIESSGIAIAFEVWEEHYEPDLYGQLQSPLSLVDLTLALFTRQQPTGPRLFAAAVLAHCDNSVARIERDEVQLYRRLRFSQTNHANQEWIKTYALLHSINRRDVTIYRNHVSYEEFLETIECLQAFRANGSTLTYAWSYLPCPEERIQNMDLRKAKLSMELAFREFKPKHAEWLISTWGLRKGFDEYILLCAAYIFRSPDEDASEREAMYLLENGLVPDGDKDIRLDMTHLSAYCIDDSHTFDPDDAISFGKFNDGVDTKDYVHVHITDVTRYLPENINNALYKNAFFRTASNYLPRETLAMFPASITKEMLAFCAAQSDHSALTFSFPVYTGLINSKIFSINLTRLRKPLRLTYEEAERMLLTTFDAEPDQRIEDIQSIHNTLQRNEFNEAISEPHISIASERGKEIISITTTKKTPRAHFLVSTLMQATNLAGAHYAHNSHLPFCFRGFANRKDGMQFSVKPLAHPYFRFVPYTFVTSPVRRAIDVINHIQLKAQVRTAHGKPPGLCLSTNDIESNIETYSFADKLYRMNAMEKRLRKYYTYKRLQFMTKPLKGVYIGRCLEPGNMAPECCQLWAAKSTNGEPENVVHLEETGLKLFCKMDGGIELGAHVQVRIASIDVESMEHDVTAETVTK